MATEFSRPDTMLELIGDVNCGEIAASIDEDDLLNLLSEGQEQERVFAAAIFSECSSDFGISLDELAASIHDPEKSVRAFVVRAVGVREWGDDNARAIALLREAEADPDTVVRDEARRAKKQLLERSEN